MDRRTGSRKPGNLDVIELWNDDGELEGYTLMNRDSLSLHTRIFSTRGAAAIWAGDFLYRKEVELCG